jgi:hypothetical protein
MCKDWGAAVGGIQLTTHLGLKPTGERITAIFHLR